MHKLGKKKIRIKELCRVPGTPAALDTYLFLIDYAALDTTVVAEEVAEVKR
jgi:hypothetical protein